MQRRHATKRVLTTGEVAKLCSVAPRTVSKWFDSGRLRGYRIPGSKDRRIPLDQLIAFMRAHNIPLNGLVSDTRRVVVLDDDRSFTAALTRALHDAGGYDVVIADSAFEAGVLVRESPTQVLIVDVNRADVDARELRRVLRTTAELRDLRVIGVGTGAPDVDYRTPARLGLDAYLAKPFEARKLLDLIESEADAPAAANSAPSP